MSNKKKLDNKNIIKYIINFLKIVLFIVFIAINKNINKNNEREIKNNKTKPTSLIFKILPFLHYNKPLTTKISIFIPIYNKAEYIYRSIKSVQVQTLRDIEIIAINDHSNDNSLKILIELSKADERIKIINNEKNKGLLYSRAMGILTSSGEYLMNLDSDDELQGYNSLKNLYYKAKRYNIDIINFVFFDKKLNKNINNCNKINLVQKQPELFNSIFHTNNEIKDYNIWNKLIRREIFIQAYKAFKNEIENWKWDYYEDDVWNILVNKFAKSKLCVNRVIYIYNFNNRSLMNNKIKLIELKNLLYRHEMYKKIFQNKEKQKYFVAEYLFLLNTLKSQTKQLLLLNSPELINQIINITNYFLQNHEYSNEFKNEMFTFINSIKIK